jgi:hypothetical protein
MLRIPAPAPREKKLKSETVQIEIVVGKEFKVEFILHRFKHSNHSKHLINSKMSSSFASSVDYTPMLLTQITDLQTRLTAQEGLINSLKTEVERLTGRSINVNTMVRTSVPLLNTAGGACLSHHGSGFNTFSGGKKMGGDKYQQKDKSKYNKNDDKKYSREEFTKPNVTGMQTSISQTKLSEILKENEKVVIRIGTGKDSEGNYMYAKCDTTFNGSELLVTKCDLVEAKMVGTKTEKVGEIVYKFMNELHTAGHISRIFKPAVWKLCYVERNGKEFNLDELRNTA